MRLALHRMLLVFSPKSSTLTQQNLSHSTSGARGQVLDGAESIGALLQVVECFRLHGYRPIG